jgi:hypothetical protein
MNPFWTGTHLHIFMERDHKEGVIGLTFAFISAIPRLSVVVVSGYEGVLSVGDRECAGSSMSTISYKDVEFGSI